MYRKIASTGRTDYLWHPTTAARRKPVSRRDYWRALLHLFAELRWRCP